MAMDFDSQLIESVEVRRHRLTASLLYGANPTERRWKDRTKIVIYGVVAAAVICALCVAISFVVQILTNWLADRDERERQQEERQIEIERQQQEREQREQQPQGAPADLLSPTTDADVPTTAATASAALLPPALADPADLPTLAALPVFTALPAPTDLPERS